jgi:hypothetical protein
MLREEEDMKKEIERAKVECDKEKIQMAMNFLIRQVNLARDGALF